MAGERYECNAVGSKRRSTEENATDVARNVIAHMLQRIGASNAYQLCTSASHAQCWSRSPAASANEVEVRWMASGALACFVPSASEVNVTDVKRHICEQLQVPVDEQRLFKDGSELVRESYHLEADSAALLLVRSVSDPRITNLAHFRIPSGTIFPALPEGTFTQLHLVAKGITSDIFAYRCPSREGDMTVAMKRVSADALEWNRNKETDERSVHLKPWRDNPKLEDALTEIGVFTYLASQDDRSEYLLKMMGVFAEDSFVCLITEFAEGGELFSVAAAGKTPEPKIKFYMLQMMQAVDYLHRHSIAHRDLSLENVLLKGDDVRVIDFGMAVRSHSASGTPLRYYLPAGKDNYRAPECYVPQQEKVSITVPADATPGEVRMVKIANNYLCEVCIPPDGVPGSVCKAEPWGYAAPPLDIFALGVCFFILSYQGPAWNKAKPSDPYFAHVQEKGLESLLKLWHKDFLSADAMQLLSSMLRAEPSQRPSAADILAGPWLTSKQC